MKYTYILLFSLLSIFGVSQNTMTVEKALSIGLENNFGIKIADKAIQIAENNNTWARAGKTPTVDLNGYYNNNLVNDSNPASFLQGTYYNTSLGATANVNWVLYNGGRIQINKDQLDLAVRQSSVPARTTCCTKSDTSIITG